MDEKHFVEDVVGMDRLREMTAAGWRVVERVEYDEPIDLMDTHVPPTPPNGYAPSPIQIQRTAIGRTVAFRVRRLGDDMVAQLSEQAATLSQSLRKAGEDKRFADEAWGRERVEHESTKGRLRVESETSGRLREEVSLVTGLRRKLETDLGKIREAIGRKAYEEILPPQPAKHEERDR